MSGVNGYAFKEFVAAAGIEVVDRIDFVSFHLLARNMPVAEVKQ